MAEARPTFLQRMTNGALAGLTLLGATFGAVPGKAAEAVSAAPQIISSDEGSPPPKVTTPQKIKSIAQPAAKRAAPIPKIVQAAPVKPLKPLTAVELRGQLRDAEAENDRLTHEANQKVADTQKLLDEANEAAKSAKDAAKTADDRASKASDAQNKAERALSYERNDRILFTPTALIGGFVGGLLAAAGARRLRRKAPLNTTAQTEVASDGPRPTPNANDLRIDPVVPMPPRAARNASPASAASDGTVAAPVDAPSFLAKNTRARAAAVPQRIHPDTFKVPDAAEIAAASAPVAAAPEAIERLILSAAEKKALADVTQLPLFAGNIRVTAPEDISLEHNGRTAAVEQVEFVTIRKIPGRTLDGIPGHKIIVSPIDDRLTPLAGEVQGETILETDRDTVTIISAGQISLGSKAGDFEIAAAAAYALSVRLASNNTIANIDVGGTNAQRARFNEIFADFAQRQAAIAATPDAVDANRPILLSQIEKDVANAMLAQPTKQEHIAIKTVMRDNVEEIQFSDVGADNPYIFVYGHVSDGKRTRVIEFAQDANDVDLQRAAFYMGHMNQLVVARRFTPVSTHVIATETQIERLNEIFADPRLINYGGTLFVEQGGKVIAESTMENSPAPARKEIPPVEAAQQPASLSASITAADNIYTSYAAALPFGQHTVPFTLRTANTPDESIDGKPVVAPEAKSGEAVRAAGTPMDIEKTNLELQALLAGFKRTQPGTAAATGGQVSTDIAEIYVSDAERETAIMLETLLGNLTASPVMLERGKEMSAFAQDEGHPADTVEQIQIRFDGTNESNVLIRPGVLELTADAKPADFRYAAMYVVELARKMGSAIDLKAIKTADRVQQKQLDKAIAGYVAELGAQSAASFAAVEKALAVTAQKPETKADTIVAPPPQVEPVVIAAAPLQPEQPAVAEPAAAAAPAQTQPVAQKQKTAGEETHLVLVDKNNNLLRKLGLLAIDPATDERVLTTEDGRKIKANKLMAFINETSMTMKSRGLKAVPLKTRELPVTMRDLDQAARKLLDEVMKNKTYEINGKKLTATAEAPREARTAQPAPTVAKTAPAIAPAPLRLVRAEAKPKPEPAPQVEIIVPSTGNNEPVNIKFPVPADSTRDVTVTQKATPSVTVEKKSGAEASQPARAVAIAQDSGDTDAATFRNMRAMREASTRYQDLNSSSSTGARHTSIVTSPLKTGGSSVAEMAADIGIGYVARDGQGSTKAEMKPHRPADPTIADAVTVQQLAAE